MVLSSSGLFWGWSPLLQTPLNITADRQKLTACSVCVSVGKKVSNIYNESERATILCEYESRLTSPVTVTLWSSRGRRGGGGALRCNRLSWDKALIKHDPQSFIIQTASAAGLINGMDLDDTTPLSALINNSHAALFYLWNASNPLNSPAPSAFSKKTQAWRKLKEPRMVAATGTPSAIPWSWCSVWRPSWFRAMEATCRCGWRHPMRTRWRWSRPTPWCSPCRVLYLRRSCWAATAACWSWERAPTVPLCLTSLSGEAGTEDAPPPQHQGNIHLCPSGSLQLSLIELAHPLEGGSVKLQL